MTAERSRRLRTTQRRMLRQIVRTSRQQVSTTETGDTDSSGGSALLEEDAEEESWVDWVIRATAIAEDRRDEAQVEDWQLAQRRRYWRWAGHVARQKDNRWTVKALTWTPGTGFRTRGRPVKRWHEDLDEFFCHKLGHARGHWMTAAQDRDFWKSLEQDFVHDTALETILENDEED